VLHEGGVPQEADDEDVHEQNDEEHNKSFNAFACASAAKEFLNDAHLQCIEKKTF